MSAVLQQPRLEIRRMQPVDLDAVMTVEVVAYTHPWSREIFIDCMKAGYQCHVLASDTSLSAYGVMSLGAGEAHILNLCVSPADQHKGIGRRLLRHLLQVAGERRTETVFLEVRASNKFANSLYQSEGFNEIGRRNDYYPAEKRREDALVFAKSLL